MVRELYLYTCYMQEALLSSDNLTNPEDIKTAGQEAEILMKEINQSNNLDPAFSALQVAIAQYTQTGGKVEQLIPAEVGGSGMGWALFKKGKTGEGFFRLFLKGMQKEICNEKGQLRKIISEATNKGITAAITALVATLALPFAFLPPIAALLVSKGIDYWCKRVNE